MSTSWIALLAWQKKVTPPMLLCLAIFRFFSTAPYTEVRKICRYLLSSREVNNYLLPDGSMLCLIHDLILDWCDTPSIVDHHHFFSKRNSQFLYWSARFQRSTQICIMKRRSFSGDQYCNYCSSKRRRKWYFLVFNFCQNALVKIFCKQVIIPRHIFTSFIIWIRRSCGARDLLIFNPFVRRRSAGLISALVWCPLVRRGFPFDWMEPF